MRFDDNFRVIDFEEPGLKGTVSHAMTSDDLEVRVQFVTYGYVRVPMAECLTGQYAMVDRLSAAARKAADLAKAEARRALGPVE